MLRVVGQMGATYIVAEGPEGMYLVDQHAAHERILFEQMLGQQAGGGVAQQALLEPLVFEAGTSYGGLLAEYAEALTAAGFGLEPFGSDTWLVRAVPAVYRPRRSAPRAGGDAGGHRRRPRPGGREQGGRAGGRDLQAGRDQGRAGAGPGGDAPARAPARSLPEPRFVSRTAGRRCWC